jgi:hypothetical protein
VLFSLAEVVELMGNCCFSREQDTATHGHGTGVVNKKSGGIAYAEVNLIVRDYVSVTAPLTKHVSRQGAA